MDFWVKRLVRNPSWTGHGRRLDDWIVLDRTTEGMCHLITRSFFLVELDLSNNQLQGEIPDEIFELSNLGKKDGQIS